MALLRAITITRFPARQMCAASKHITKAFKKSILGNQLLVVHLPPVCCTLHQLCHLREVWSPKWRGWVSKNVNVSYLLSSWCYPDGVSLLAGPTSQQTAMLSFFVLWQQGNYPHLKSWRLRAWDSVNLLSTSGVKCSMCFDWVKEEIVLLWKKWGVKFWSYHMWGFVLVCFVFPKDAYIGY